MTTPNEPMPNGNPQPAAGTGMPEQQTPASTQQPTGQIPTQQFPKAVNDVYGSIKQLLSGNVMFALTNADDVTQRVTFTSRNAGASYTAVVLPSAQNGSVVQILPANPSDPNVQMEATVFFGDLTRQLMMTTRPNGQGAQPRVQGAHKKSMSWVFIVSVAALVVSVLALILLLVLTPNTGAWLVWMLGGISVALSGFSLYASLALSKETLNRILSGVAVGISVIALILGFVTLPTGTSAASGSTQTRESGSSKSLDSTAGSPTEDGENPSDTPDDGTNSNESLESILSAIESDTNKTIESINAKLTETEGKMGDTYDSYVANKKELENWYASVDTEASALYVKIGEQSVKYYQALAQQAKNNKYLDAKEMMKDYYSAVYEDDFKNLYSSIYEDSFKEVYEKYYDGSLKDAYNTIPYEQWSDTRSTAYSEWSDTRSDFYSLWSDARSDVYGMYSDINSEIWDKDYDFSKVIERYQKKFAKYKTTE